MDYRCRLISISEAARYASVASESVRYWCLTGIQVSGRVIVLEHVRRAGKLFTTQADVDAFRSRTGVGRGQGLTARQHEAVAMRFSDRPCSYAEMARFLGVSRVAARALVQRAGGRVKRMAESEVSHV